MPSRLPEGELPPADGSLPQASIAEAIGRPFGIYVHVPYCASRCGYCDFNTYTATELGGTASQAGYADTAIRELTLARRVLGELDRPADTVFFGGGTPTLLPPGDLARLLTTIRDQFGLRADAEVTTEANPESVDPQSLEQLRAAGFTRISYGMQSAIPQVLSVLDRQHSPGRPLAAVAEARAAGFEHINLDLIYGTPGESLADWRHSLEQALEAGPDHVSAYALIVEDGTRLAHRIRRGELPMPDDDDLADKYLLADEVLTSAGLGWYEVSNWAAGEAARCRHNELYWSGDTWWGIGPGAHSHVGGVRWWNVKHPREYGDRLAAGRSPAYAREHLDSDSRRMERVMLELRMVSGLPLDVLDAASRTEADTAATEGLLVLDKERAVLTQRGRLLADAVVRQLLA